MKKKFLFITCEEAHHICDKSQYGEATLWERFKLSIRLSWCQVTRSYTKRNRTLTKVIKSSKTDQGFNEKELDLFKSEFQNELKKH